MTPPSTSTRRSTRDAIVAAAWQLAGRDGIASLSVRDLAAEVGIRAPSLYHHFDGKDAIYDAMYRQGHAQVNELVDGMQLPTSRRAAMVSACQAWLDFCRADWSRYQLMYTRVIPNWEPSSDAYAVAVQGFDAMRRQLSMLGLDDLAIDLYVAISAGLAAQQFANDPEGDRWIGLAQPAMESLYDHPPNDPAAATFDQDGATT